MILRLGNGIRMRLQRVLQLCRNLRDEEDIDRPWEYIKENIQTSAKLNLVLHELGLINDRLMKNV
jgi:hypothetical protein